MNKIYKRTTPNKNMLELEERIKIMVPEIHPTKDFVEEIFELNDERLLLERAFSDDNLSWFEKAKKKVLKYLGTPKKEFNFTDFYKKLDATYDAKVKRLLSTCEIPLTKDHVIKIIPEKRSSTHDNEDRVAIIIDNQKTNPNYKQNLKDKIQFTVYPTTQNIDIKLPAIKRITVDIYDNNFSYEKGDRPERKVIEIVYSN